VFVKGGIKGLLLCTAAPLVISHRIIALLSFESANIATNFSAASQIVDGRDTSVW